MQTTHIKEFLANTKLTKTEVAEALKVTRQHLNDTIRKEIDVYIVHEGTKSLTAFKSANGAMYYDDFYFVKLSRLAGDACADCWQQVGSEFLAVEKPHYAAFFVLC